MTTTVISGAGCSKQELQLQLASGTSLVVIDQRAGFDSSDLTGADVRVEKVHVEVGGLGFDVIRHLSSIISSVDPHTVIAIGGGSVMDAVKVAALAESRRGLADLLLQRSSRAGLVRVGTSAVRKRKLTLVPTTLGTSSEVNATAIFNTPHGRKIVMGEVLRAEVAVLDSDLTERLPRWLIAEGMMEAFLRVAGVFAWARRERRVEEVSVDIARDILIAGSGSVSAQGPRHRLALGKLSGHTHTSGSLTCATSYPMKHWYIANELSFLLGITKIQATVPLIRPIWGRILAGDSRFGSRDALESFWQQVCDLIPGKSTDPLVGFQNLANALQLETYVELHSADIHTSASRTFRYWGSHLPMLSGISAGEIERLLLEAGRPSSLQGDRSL